MDSESPKDKNNHTTTSEPRQHTENKQTPDVSRKQIGIRLLYTILFLFILGIVIVMVKLVVFFQFIYCFGTRRPNESVRQFSNKLSSYAYRIFRYISFNENKRPFPFNDFPSELDPSEERMTF